MRICNKEYAALWALCGIATKNMRQYAERLVTSMRYYAELQPKTMRQYADRVVTHTRHTVVFAVCIQRDGFKPLVVRIERVRQYYVMQLKENHV